MVSLPHHPPTERNKLASLDKISSEKMTSLQTEIGDRCQRERTGKSQWTAPTLAPGLVGSNWSDGGTSPLQDKAVVGNCGKYVPGEKQLPSENQRLGKADKVQGLASCPHSGAGCAWRGAASDLPGHLATQVVAYSAI